MRFIPTGELIVHEAMAFEVKIKGRIVFDTERYGKGVHVREWKDTQTVLPKKQM